MLERGLGSGMVVRVVGSRDSKLLVLFCHWMEFGLVVHHIGNRSDRVKGEDREFLWNCGEVS